jgi:hypothetical protein
MACIVEQFPRSGLKAPAVLCEGDAEPLAVGGRLLVRERQTSKLL